MTRLAIVGDFDESFLPHVATQRSISHSARALNVEVVSEWVPTVTFEATGSRRASGYQGFLISPGSPYQSLAGAMRAIQFARTEDVPLLGTCGGFQHVVLEFARNVLEFSDAQHAEYDPYASRLFITPLSCSLVGQRMKVVLAAGSRAERIYGKTQISEEYYCNFGLNPEYERDLEDAGLRVSGRDDAGEARVLELAGHPFFLATLFVPQLSSTFEKPHPVITAFVAAALHREAAE